MFIKIIWKSCSMFGNSLKTLINFGWRNIIFCKSFRAIEIRCWSFFSTLLPFTMSRCCCSTAKTKF